MSRAGNNMVGIIYIKFEDVGAGISLKNNISRDELKEYVPITAITKIIPYSHKNVTATV